MSGRNLEFQRTNVRIRRLSWRSLRGSGRLTLCDVAESAGQVTPLCRWISTSRILMLRLAVAFLGAPPAVPFPLSLASLGVGVEVRAVPVGPCRATRFAAAAVVAVRGDGAVARIVGC